MNARALARHYAALIGEGVGGTRLLTPERVRLATVPHTTGPDVVLGATIPRGLGYWLGGPGSPMGPGPDAFGHPGAGGSLGFADPGHCLAFALTRNRLAPGGMEGTTALVAAEVRAALGIPGEAAPR
jgi:CubicO group peptidase (beta-lactamase class C family)